MTPNPELEVGIHGSDTGDYTVDLRFRRATDDRQVDHIDGRLRRKDRQQVAIDIRETLQARSAIRVHDEQQAHLAVIGIELRL